MRPHLRYLRYVLLHKWYVFRAGLLIGRPSIPWLWRLLVHDLSKFRPSEWGPYVAQFYGGKPNTAKFNRAWLLHQHRNPHHWQHWVLREDSGKTIVMTMPQDVAMEMLADWMGAGSKITQAVPPGMTRMQFLVRETAEWYVNTHQQRLLRDVPRMFVEETLIHLCKSQGLVDYEFVRPARSMVNLVQPF